MTEISQFSASELVAGIGRRQFSITDVVNASLSRIRDYNPAINAVVAANPDVLDQASAADRRLAAGNALRPLEGVPFVVKDNIAAKGLRTTFGSMVYESNVSDCDAISVERLRAAGALLLGKSNTSEFATDINTNNKIFGLTRNPVDLNVSAGGSSGGSAAAVAADMAPLALGTDHGGSIRIPSAWCGVCGLRPSPGRVAVYRTDFAWDTLVAHVEGPIARTVEDLGLMMSVIAGPDGRDPMSLPSEGLNYAGAAKALELKDLRIAYSSNLNGLFPVDPEVEAASRSAARAFEDMGCFVEEASFDTSDLREIIAGTRGFGMVARFADLVERFGERISPQVVGQVSDGLRLSVGAITKAERLRTAYWHRMHAFFERYDLLLTPTVGAPPFRVDQSLPRTVGGNAVDRYYDIFLATYAFSVAGVPAASVPCGFTKQGLPIGLQIVGRRLCDDSVLSAAAAYTAHCPQHLTRRPIPLAAAVPLSRDFVPPRERL